MVKFAKLLIHYLRQILYFKLPVGKTQGGIFFGHCLLLQLWRREEVGLIVRRRRCFLAPESENRKSKTESSVRTFVVKWSAVCRLQLHLAHALRSILHRACQIKSRLTGWCWRGCAWHAGTASWTKAFSPSSAAREWSVGPKCSLKFDKFLVYNSRQSEYESVLYYVSMSPWFTFLIWSLGNTVHADIIWISKLVPVLAGNTEQALDNLEGGGKIQHFKLNLSVLYSSEEPRPSLYLWLSARVVQDGHGVWVRNSVAHQSGTKHPGQVSHIHLSVDALWDSGGR